MSALRLKGTTRKHAPIRAGIVNPYRVSPMERWHSGRTALSAALDAVWHSPGVAALLAQASALASAMDEDWETNRAACRLIEALDGTCPS